MKKDVSRKNAKNGLGIRIKWYWAVLVLMVTVVASLVALFVYQPKYANQVLPPVVVAYAEKIQIWVVDHKSRLNQNLAKVKQIARNKSDDNEPIHFEFYTALPKMQVKVAEAQAEVKTPRPVQDKPATIEVKLANAIKPYAVNPEQLEREFSNDLKQNNYVVQLGSFKNPGAAEQYRMSLADAGFPASLVAGTGVYRIQVGPFGNKEQAKVAQRQLRQKGVNGIVRKLEFIG